MGVEYNVNGTGMRRLLGNGCGYKKSFLSFIRNAPLETFCSLKGAQVYKIIQIAKIANP